jgi:hypothetical protein
LAQAFNPAAPKAEKVEPEMGPPTTGRHRFTKAYADQQRREAGGDVENIIGSALRQAGVIA